MYNIKIDYKGSFITRPIHMESGEIIFTDAPKDNQGSGTSFSPTDLISCALGSCILTIMGIVATRHSVDLKGTRCEVSKTMRSNPRQIHSILVEIYFVNFYNDKNRKLLEKAALSCPVHRSLSSSIKKQISFHYPHDE